MAEENICVLEEMLGCYFRSLAEEPQLHEGTDLLHDFRGWFVGWRESAVNFSQEDPYDPQEAEDLLVNALRVLKSKAWLELL